MGTDAAGSVRLDVAVQPRVPTRDYHYVSTLGYSIGLTHEITIVQGQVREGVYAEDRSIRVLG